MQLAELCSEPDPQASLAAMEMLGTPIPRLASTVCSRHLRAHPRDGTGNLKRTIRAGELKATKPPRNQGLSVLMSEGEPLKDHINHLGRHSSKILALHSPLRTPFNSLLGGALAYRVFDVSWRVRFIPPGLGQREHSVGTHLLHVYSHKNIIINFFFLRVGCLFSYKRFKDAVPFSEFPTALCNEICFTLLPFSENVSSH